MKRITLFVGCVFILALALSSCRTQKKACAAYSKANTEKLQDKDIAS